MSNVYSTYVLSYLIHCFYVFQVTECFGGDRSIQALQQTPRVCADETPSWVPGQARYVAVFGPSRASAAAALELTTATNNHCFPHLRSLSLSLSLFFPSDIPVFPTITATVTFQEFRYSEFEDSIFSIPAEYKEDPSRFPDLWCDSHPVSTSRSPVDKGGEKKTGGRDANSP